MGWYGLDVIRYYGLDVILLTAGSDVLWTKCDVMDWRTGCDVD